jgi:multisubunit Na+/H+ antiporter MnhG subunit
LRHGPIVNHEYSGRGGRIVVRTYNGYVMPCLLLLIGLAFPRLAIVALFFLTTFFERAYHSLLLVAVGFVFLPLTTIVYAWIVNERYPLSGIYLAVLIIAVLADVGIIGQGGYRSRRAD